MPLGLGALLLVVVWHLRRLRSLPPRPRRAYLLSRLFILAFFLLRWAVARGSPPGRARFIGTHIHHYYLGYLVSLWGAFDHPLSAALLAVGCGLMVQGIAAYHAAALFPRTPAGAVAQAEAFGCAFVDSNATAANLSCTFWPPYSGEGWGLELCPTTSDRLRFACSPQF